MTARHISIELLGTFSVSVDGVTVTEDLLRHRRAADLVKLLALTPRHRNPRDRVIEALWPGAIPERGSANLRKAAHLARRALGFAEGVVLDGENAVLAPGSEVETDVAKFEVAARAAEDAADARRAALLYRGELLPDDRYADWCQEERSHLFSAYLSVLEEARLWGRLVEVDPVNERAHQEIMSAELASGDRAAVLRQFEHLRLTLRDQLGVLPGKESMRIYEEALSLDAPESPTAAERARALLAWGMVHWKRNDTEEASRTAETARALAIDAGLGRELADASELLGLIAYAQGRWREVFSSQILDSMQRDPGLTPFLFDAHICMTEFALFEEDGIDQITAVSEEVLASDDTTGHGRALGLLLRGEARLLGTNPLDPGAATDLRESEQIHRELGSPTGHAVALERLAQLDSLTGNRRKGLQRHREALEVAFGSPVRRHLVPFVYGGMLADLDADDALAVTLEAEKDTEGLELCESCSMGYRLGAIRAAVHSHDWTRAHDHMEKAQTVVKMWPGGPWHAAVAEAEAAIAVAEGDDPERARRLLVEAIEGYEASTRPRDAARCRHALHGLG